MWDFRSFGIDFDAIREVKSHLGLHAFLKQISQLVFKILGRGRERGNLEYLGEKLPPPPTQKNLVRLFCGQCFVLQVRQHI